MTIIFVKSIIAFYNFAKKFIINVICARKVAIVRYLRGCTKKVVYYYVKIIDKTVAKW